jgi:hypothetical protein
MVEQYPAHLVHKKTSEVLASEVFDFLRGCLPTSKRDWFLCIIICIGIHREI